jgi:hypothetical protein
MGHMRGFLITTSLMWPNGYTGVGHPGDETDVPNAAGARVATTGKTCQVKNGVGGGNSRLFPVCEGTAIGARSSGA